MPPAPDPTLCPRITADDDYSYAGASNLEHTRAHGWAHSMDEILRALTGAGLRVEFVEEYPWSTLAPIDAMEEDENGRYYLDTDEDLPFVFTLRARPAERE